MNCACDTADVDVDVGKPRKPQDVSVFLHTCLWYPIYLSIEAVSDEPISVPPPPDYSCKDRQLDRDHIILKKF